MTRHEQAIRESERRAILRIIDKERRAYQSYGPTPEYERAVYVCWTLAQLVRARRP